MKITSAQQAGFTSLAAMNKLVQSTTEGKQETPIVTVKPGSSQFAYDALNATANIRLAGLSTGSSALSVADALARIKAEGETVDRSAMSDKEVIEEMYGRFTKYLGGERFPTTDFINTYAEQPDVTTAFNKEINGLKAQGWTIERFQNAQAEMRGYGGMTQEEMQHAIAAKYNKIGMAPITFINMMNEMRHTGAMSDIECFSIASSIVSSIDTHVHNTYIKQGYTTKEVFSTYLGEYQQSLLYAMKQPMSLSAIFDDQLFRMTDGGDMSAKLESTIRGFFGKILSY